MPQRRSPYGRIRAAKLCRTSPIFRAICPVYCGIQFKIEFCFLKIFYLNLDHRNDRQYAMETRLAELSLAATRISAVTPQQLTQAQKLACSRSHHTSDPIIEVEMCCNLSHKLAYEAFLASNDAFAVIFEDDALIADDLPEVLSAIEREGMPCDLLRLETYIDRTQFGLRSRAQYGRYSVRSMHSYTWGTAGYVISRKAAARYLTQPEFLGITTDRSLWRRLPNATGLKILQLYPAPVVQTDRVTGDADLKSNIGPTRSLVYEKIKKNEPLLAKLRRFCRDEFTIALPALVHRALKLSDRGSIPFSGTRQSPGE